MKRPAPIFCLVLLLTVCFTLATALDPRSVNLGKRDQSGNLFKVLLGNGREIFANHFFEKADVYFHSGYYPSFFEQSYGRMPDPKHFAEEHHHHDEGAGHPDKDEEAEEREEHAHERAMDFLGQSKDWIDSFGRHFYSSRHSHLDKPGAAREILPWLKISAELDPHRIETYTVAAYWLRSNMQKPAQAEEFLREGLKENPDSYEILFELGKIYFENYHNPDHARNLWELALQRWREQETAHKDPNPVTFDGIAANLANLEEKQGNLKAAISDLQMELKVTPAPEAVQKHIADLQQKLASPAAH